MRPPLADVRGTLRVRWYRSPIDPGMLRQLMRRSDLQGWWQALGVIGYLAGTALVTYHFFARQQWVAFAVALFAYGTYSCFLGAASHELDHGTVFRTKALNRFFLRLFSLITWFNPGRLRAQPHLPSSLHAAPGRRPRGGAAAVGGDARPVRAAVVLRQPDRRAGLRRIDSTGPGHGAHGARQEARQGRHRATPNRWRRMPTSGWRRCTRHTPRNGSRRCAGRARSCCSTPP